MRRRRGSRQERRWTRGESKAEEQAEGCIHVPHVARAHVEARPRAVEEQAHTSRRREAMAGRLLLLPPRRPRLCGVFLLEERLQRLACRDTRWRGGVSTQLHGRSEVRAVLSVVWGGASLFREMQSPSIQSPGRTERQRAEGRARHQRRRQRLRARGVRRRARVCGGGASR